MKCVSCGSDFRFLDGFLTTKGMVCPRCKEKEKPAGRPSEEALAAMGVRVTVRARVDRAIRDVFETDDFFKAEGALAAVVTAGEEKGTPDRLAALLWRALFAAARYRMASRLVETTRKALEEVPADQRRQFEAGVDVAAMEKAVTSAGLWTPIPIQDFLNEDDGKTAVPLAVPGRALEATDEWRTWRPYDRARMSGIETNVLDSSLGWEDAALQRWLQRETGRSRTVLVRLALLEAFGAATGQGESPARAEAEVDRAAAARWLDALLEEVLGRLGAAAAGSAGTFRDVRGRLASLL